MTSEEFERLKLDYIDGVIAQADLNKLTDYLQTNNQSLAELDELKQVLHDFDKKVIPPASAELDNRINHLISQNISRESWFLNQRYLLIAVYTIIILAAGTGIGLFMQSTATNRLTAEMSELRQLVLTTMNEKEASAGNRIQAISLSSQLTNLDDTVIDILLHTFNTDPNINVRLATLQVLTNYAENETIRVGLVNSITLQRSPLVQIALLNVMITWQEKSSIKQFTRLLKYPDLDGMVFNQIEAGLDKI